MIVNRKSVCVEINSGNHQIIHNLAEDLHTVPVRGRTRFPCHLSTIISENLSVTNTLTVNNYAYHARLYPFRRFLSDRNFSVSCKWRDGSTHDLLVQESDFRGFSGRSRNVIVGCGLHLKNSDLLPKEKSLCCC